MPSTTLFPPKPAYWSQIPQYKGGVDAAAFINAGASPHTPSPMSSVSQPNTAQPMSNGSFVMNNAPLEQAGDGPDLNSVNSSFAPAIKALSDYQGSLQSQLSGQSPLQGESQLRAEADNTRALYQSGLQDKKNAYAQQRTSATNATESVVGEARRQGNELLQGLQSKFGGSTGTGAFVGELTGRTVLQNISQNRAALQQTLGSIADAESSAEKKVGRQIESLNSQVMSSVQSLRDRLMSGIQEINMKRGELESQKAMKKIDLLNQFKAEKAQVEARNTAFQQQLYGQLQSTKQRAQELKGMAASQFEIALKNLDARGLQVSGGNVTDQGRFTNLQFAPKAGAGQTADGYLQSLQGGQGSQGFQNVNWDDPAVDPFNMNIGGQ